MDVEAMNFSLYADQMDSTTTLPATLGVRNRKKQAQ